MSRGSKDAVTGNIKLSMRDNYAEHGVDEYYRKVGATYRNPHFPGVRACMYLWLNRWWKEEHERIGVSRISVFDMACGWCSGEATVAFMEWWGQGRTLYTASPPSASTATITPPPRKNTPAGDPPPLGPELPTPRILAADPFTAEAYKSRTSLNCYTFSFKDIADGCLADILQDGPSQIDAPQSDDGRTGGDLMEMTICSFALHLIESPSELFALLWELSLRCRWLVILAPHKKPEIKLGWGWIKWDVGTWTECSMSQTNGELLRDRVHCRVYRSVNTQ